MYANFCAVLAALSAVVLVAAAAAAKSTKQFSGKSAKYSANARPTAALEDRGSGDWDDGDDYDAEGSTAVKNNDCHLVRDKIKSRKIKGAYIPQCTEEGEYRPIQCTNDPSGRNDCFCVDLAGDEVPNTRVPHPRTPNCSNLRNEKEQDQGTSSLSRQSTSSSSNDGWVYVKARPTLLAGIIGGTVVGLLCAMLLLLFIIYRLRKKDEGSYALDEPKNSPAVAYTKAHDREFFA